MTFASIYPGKTESRELLEGLGHRGQMESMVVDTVCKDSAAVGEETLRRPADLVGQERMVSQGGPAATGGQSLCSSRTAPIQRY